MIRRISAAFAIVCCACLVVALAEEKEGQKKATKKPPEGPHVVGQRPRGMDPAFPPARRATRITRDTGEAPAAKRLTFDELGAMLEETGNKPTKKTNQSGDWWEVIVEREGGWKFTVTANFSGDQSNIWFGVYLENVAADSFPLDNALGLLEANNSIWPAYFFYGKESGGLYIYQALPNMGLTKEALSTSLNDITSRVQQTSALWDIVQ